MSLLEDVFLEDEAGEAQELERIIEGDEYDERPRPSSPNSNDNSEREDEAEEDKRRVEPTSDKPKRVVKNPRVVLNPARLTGPRGIQVIPEHFEDFKFKGKGHEKEDLDLVLKKLEHWAYRLFPKFEFKDCLKKIETLGNKRPVMVHLTKIRTDQFMSEDTVVQRDSSDDEAAVAPVQEEDEFDKLLQQQIDLARSTPAPGSTRKPAFSTPMVEKSITMPKATSSPSINDEQRERMLRNRQLAEERRLARLKLNASLTNTSAKENSMTNIQKDSDTSDDPTAQDKSNSVYLNTVLESTENDITDQIIDEDENIAKAKNNKSNVIDSSDEDDVLVINESIAVDVHDSHKYDENYEERHSDNYGRREHTDTEDIEEIRTENDIEMNAIENVTENQHRHTENDKIVQLDNAGNLEVNSDVSKKNEELNTKIKSDALESGNAKLEHSEVVNDDITENGSSQYKNNQSKSAEAVVEENSCCEKSKENQLKNIMDVDFSDDF